MFLEEYLKITKKKGKNQKTIDSKTCSNKLRVRQIRIPIQIPQELEQCIGCNNYQVNYECKNFKPYQFTFPVRTGIYAAMQ